MRFSLALIALYLLALPAPAPANPPTVSDLREGDQATWNGTALSFSSAIGIGQATLTPSGKCSSSTVVDTRSGPEGARALAWLARRGGSRCDYRLPAGTGIDLEKAWRLRNPDGFQ